MMSSSVTGIGLKISFKTSKIQGEIDKANNQEIDSCC